MKNFINKNWKNIFIIIGAIFLVIDLFYIVTTPATVPQDFLEYGPTVEKDVFDSASDISSDISTELDASGELTTEVSENTGLSPTLAHGFLILGIGLVVILVLSSLADGGGSSDKKKK